MTFAQFIGSGSNGIIGVINTIIVPLIFGLAFLVFVWGIVKHFFLNPASKDSFGERGGYGEGRQFVIWGILGMVVMLSVWGLLNMLLSTLGIMPTSDSVPVGGTVTSTFPIVGTIIGGSAETDSKVFNSNGYLLGKVNLSGNIVNISGQVVGKIVNGQAFTPSGTLITGATIQSQFYGGSTQGSGTQVGASTGPVPPSQTPELYMGRDQFLFIPVNWDQTKGDFNIFASAAMQEFKKQYLDVNKRAFPLLDNDEAYFNSVFEAINVTNCINTCHFESIPEVLDLESKCTNKCIDKNILYDPIPTFIGISNNENFFGTNYQEYTNLIVDMSDIGNVSVAVHEISHLFWSLCDEYKYSVWEQQDRDWPDYKGVKGCPNKYPLTCADHPKWVNDEDGYLTYVHGQGLTWGGYKQTDVNEEAEKNSNTSLCAGAVCTPSAGYDQCRSVMGPAFSQDHTLYYFGGKLETRIPIEAFWQDS